MNIARKLVLLCAAVMAVMALGASSAAADTSIEVSQEGGTHCNPCSVLASGESELRILGTLNSRCEDTFEANINENGTGTITYSNEDHHTTVGPGCTRIACTGQGEPAAEHPFAIQSAEEIAAQQGEMSVRFCLDQRSNPTAAGQHCTGDVIVDDLGGHNYQFSMHQSCFLGLAEIRGVWTTVADPDHDTIEITHL